MTVYGFPDIFFDVVDKMRPFGDIINITDTAGVLTFEVTGITDLLKDEQTVVFSGYSEQQKNGQ